MNQLRVVEDLRHGPLIVKELLGQLIQNLFCNVKHLLCVILSCLHIILLIINWVLISLSRRFHLFLSIALLIVARLLLILLAVLTELQLVCFIVGVVTVSFDFCRVFSLTQLFLLLVVVWTLRS